MSTQESILVTVQNVEQKYSRFHLRIPSLEVAKGDFFSIIGPSGSGKSTLLRLIGGFGTPYRGSIRVGGVDPTHQKGRSRIIRTVFQDLALFPHMTVAQQLELAARLAGHTNDARRQLATQWIDRLQLGAKRDSRPHQLSGGQRQRLALGRAMIANPKLLLLDEPMTALDHGLRLDLWKYIDDLDRDSDTTFIVITHDPDIALSRSNRIAVLEEGQCIQVGTPTELYRQPGNQTVARLLGSANVVKWQGREFVVRPERIVIAPIPVQKDFSDIAVLLRCAYYGSMIEYTLAWGNREHILVRGMVDEERTLSIQEQVYFGWNNDDVTYLN